MGHKERNGGGRTGCNLNPRAWGGGGCLRGDTEHTLIWRSAPQDNMWDPQLPGPRSAAEAGPWARVGRVVSGLRHVSLCCWVGRGPGSPACAGWGRAGLWSSPDEEVLLRFASWLCSGCQKPGGGEQAAGSCPAPLWSGCCLPPRDAAPEGCVSGSCEEQALSCHAQLWFKAGSTASQTR